MTFDYVVPTVPEDCTFRISPSQIDKFFASPVLWYKDNFMGENSFTGNTGSTLGTVIHAIAEAVGKDEATSRDIIEEYLATIIDPEIDLDVVREHYPEMSMALVNEYILPNMPTEVEYQTCANVTEGIYIAGTVDNRTGDTIVDYKNVTVKPNTEKIPFKYLIQLLAYAFADRDRGIATSRVRLVYTVRRTKTLPVRIFVVNHEITSNDWDMISNTLLLMALTVIKHKEDPDLIPLLYKSMQLS